MKDSLLRKQNKRKLFNTRKKRNFLLRSYQVFSNFSPTKRYMEQMRKRYEMLCPEGVRENMCRTMGMCYLIWISSALVIFFMFGLFPSIYTMGITILTVFALNRELLEQSVDSMERTLLNQMNIFLSDTRHSFYKHGMIDEAIEDAWEKTGRIMKVNAKKIQGVLESNDTETSIRRYNETVSNRFLRMFLSVTVYVAEFGDKIVDGVSVLLLNINVLKSDIYIEYMNKKETNYKFSGMAFVALAPVYTLRLIRAWAIDIAPELINFYDGVLGISLMIIIYVLTITMYLMINELRGRNTVKTKEHFFIKSLSRIKVIYRLLKNFEEKNRLKMEKLENLLYRVGEKYNGKQFMLKRFLYGIVAFIICIFITISMHQSIKNTTINSPVFITKSENSISDRYKQSSWNVVLELMSDYKASNLNREDVDSQVRIKGSFANESVVSAITNEVIARIDKYNSEYFYWYELIMAIFLAYIAYLTPYLMLLYRNKVLDLNMGNEVAQFQSTIMMIMHLDTTTVLGVLEQMESFAVVFKESLRVCINNYSAGDLDALEKLKIREPYEPFRRLADNLIIADKIGIQKAFDEVVEEREASREMRNQDYRITRDKKVIIGMVMAFIPAVITVALYWIIPFSVNALGGLMEYDEIMKNFREYGGE